MNRTGHYVHVTGQGWVKDGNSIPTLASSVYVPKGDIPHYDPGARRRFESKAEKRAWMQQYGLKEGGLIRNTDKRWDGPTRNSRKMSWERRKEQQAIHQHIQAQGGVHGLLDKLGVPK